MQRFGGLASSTPVGDHRVGEVLDDGRHRRQLERRIVGFRNGVFLAQMRERLVARARNAVGSIAAYEELDEVEVQRGHDDANPLAVRRDAPKRMGGTPTGSRAFRVGAVRRLIRKRPLDPSTSRFVRFHREERRVQSHFGDAYAGRVHVERLEPRVARLPGEGLVRERGGHGGFRVARERTEPGAPRGVRACIDVLMRSARRWAGRRRKPHRVAIVVGSIARTSHRGRARYQSARRSKEAQVWNSEPRDDLTRTAADARIANVEDAPSVNDSPEVLARIREGLDLVDLLARQFCRRTGYTLSRSEIASYGHEGLLHAARTYRDDRGVPFRRWANLRISGAILDGLRSVGDLPRHVYRRLAAIEAGATMQEALVETEAAAPAASAEDADHRLDLYLRGIATAMAMGVVSDKRGGDVEAVADRAPTPEEAFEREQFLRTIGEILAKLPEAEQRLIQRHYFEGTTLEEAAKELGLSKSWASRLHARAIDTVAAALQRRSRDG